VRTQLVATVLAALALWLPAASGAPCATACKDEIRRCMSVECQGLKAGPRMRCKRRTCTRPIVNACYDDLGVCGATRARPKPPSTPPPLPGY
jgi:hypothetical protein